MRSELLAYSSMKPVRPQLKPVRPPTGGLGVK